MRFTLSAILVALLSPVSASAHSASAGSRMLPVLEQTEIHLRKMHLRHQQNELSASELSWLASAEGDRFEAEALVRLRDSKFLETDPLVRDVRNWFGLFDQGRISLETLIANLRHERILVHEFLTDRSLGYGAFKGHSDGLSR